MKQKMALTMAVVNVLPITWAAKLPLTLDLNLLGYAGKKRGITGTLSAAFMF